MSRRLLFLLALIFVAISDSATHAQTDGDQPLVGPETEKRFPPLVVSEGFQATLFACDPLVEYPSVITIGPRPGTLFVAHDYMTGLGIEIVRRDEIRLISDTDEDGYADDSIVYADGFNSIQGLCFSDGSVYVMHAPFLTYLRDTDGDGIADERRDLLAGLGLPPEENSNRLHCANGVVAGHDGWLYLALGDRGCDVERPEGDRLLFQEGGILRCRADGTDVPVFSSGLRTIYYVALDDGLNVFVRDNENDGGTYMIRVCHCFHGSDHGYPYHYIDRPDLAMPPLADLGRGSSAGGTSYLETMFPGEFGESLYFCEWGRSVVRYHRERAGSSFAPMQEIDFAAGAPDDPYGFKPTDLVVDYDGSLVISDWCDGQRPKRGRARIYRISTAGHDGPAESESPAQRAINLSNEERIEQLNAPGYHLRLAAQLALQADASGVADVADAMSADRLSAHGRMHAVWVLSFGGATTDDLLALAENEPDPRVVVQIVRAVADLSDPVLLSDRIAAGRGDASLAARLAELAASRKNKPILLATMSTLARLKWPDAVTWLRTLDFEPDPALDHAMMQLMRRADNWPAVLALLDTQATAPAHEVHLRSIAVRALAEQQHAGVVDGVRARRRDEAVAGRRREYADLLALAARRPTAWTYWGFRPAPRPANTEDWERTTAVTAALNRQLADDDLDVRHFVLQRMLREGVACDVTALRHWVTDESDPGHLATILAATATLPESDAFSILEPIIMGRGLQADIRFAALEKAIEYVAPEDESSLPALASVLDDGPVLARLLDEFGRRSDPDADRLLREKLDSTIPVGRAAALAALTERGVDQIKNHVIKLLDDDDALVRRAAVVAAGRFGVDSTSDRVLELTKAADPDLQSAGLTALSDLRDPRAVQLAVSALENERSRLAGLKYLGQFGGPDQLDAVASVAKRDLSTDVQIAALRAVENWHESDAVSSSDAELLEEAMARQQGESGLLLRWRVTDAIAADEAQELTDRIRNDGMTLSETGVPLTVQIVSGADAVLRFSPGTESTDGAVWLSESVVHVESDTDIEFLAGSDGALQVFLNGESIHARETSGPFQTDSDRFGASLKPGENRVLAALSDTQSSPRLQIRFRRRSSKAEHERLISRVLSAAGNAERGREVFHNAEKSLCLKCHRFRHAKQVVACRTAGCRSRRDGSQGLGDGIDSDPRRFRGKAARATTDGHR